MLGKTLGVIRFGLVGLGVLGVLHACGGSAPAPKTTADKAAPAAPQGAEEGAPSGPLTPVAAPAELFAVARLTNPAEFAEVLSGWIHLPLPLEVAIEKELPSLRKQIALNAPIEVAASLDPEALGDPKALIAVSVPLKDYGAALTSLRERGIGVDRLSRDMSAVSLPGEQSCVVSRASGIASARLICSDDRHDVDVLAGYMATSLPLEPLTPSAFYFELKAQPLRDRFGKQAHLLKVGVPIVLRELLLGNSRLDGAVADAVHASANELLALMDDVDKLVIKANTGVKREALHIDLGFKLNGSKSWTAEALNTVAKSAGPAPEMVWRLPADVSSAGYSTAMDSKLWQPILENVSEALGGGLEYLELKGRPYQDLVTAFRDTLGMTGARVAGTGMGEEGKTPNPALADLPPWGNAFDANSYGVGAIEADEGRLKRFLDALVTAYNDAQWRKQLAKRIDNPALTKLPNFSKKNAAADLGLPKGSTQYEIAFSPALLAQLQGKSEPSASKQNLTLHMFLVPDSTRTWLGYGVDKALVTSKLKQVLTGAPETSLGSRPGLEAWRKEAAVSAGFWSVAQLADAAARYASAAKSKGSGGAALSRDTLTLAMPNKGKTPVLYSAKIEPGPTLWMSMVAPAQAMEDLAAGTVALIAQVGDDF